MDINQAKQKLRDCKKVELQDHAFGDTEIAWFDSEGKLVADGYFSRTASGVYFETPDRPEPERFEGDNARHLRECFSSMEIHRNDAGDDGL